MTTTQTDAVFSVDEILAKVIAVLEDMTQDWDLELADNINGNTRLMADLSFESIDVVQFVVSLEQSFGRKGLPFEKLFMRDGDYIDDLQVSEVVAFLKTQI